MAVWLEHHRPTFRQTAKWMLAVAHAVDYCHNKGVVHRDLKPANIMLGPQRMMGEVSLHHDFQGIEGPPAMEDENRMVPRLMDFGMAKMRIEEPTLTLNGQILGTPIYMSPEQIRNGESVDGRADIYAVGIILYQLLTGELPFRGTQEMLIQQTLHDDPQTPRKLNQSIPKDLEVITLKCLQKEPSQRYQTGNELAMDLQLWLEAKPILSRSITWWERSNRWRKRYPTTSTLLTLLIMVVVSAIVLITWQWKKAEDQRRLAVKNLAEARHAIDELLTEVGNNVLLNRPGMQPLQKELLLQALTHYQRLVENDPGNLELTRELARIWTWVASLAFQTGDAADSLNDYDRAIDLYNKLVQIDGIHSIANYERAIIYLNKATILSNMRQDEEAISFDEKGLKGIELMPVDAKGLYEQNRTLATIYANMAASYGQLGAYDEASQFNQKALNLDLDLEKTNKNDCSLEAALGRDWMNEGLLSDALCVKEQTLQNLLMGLSYFNQALKIKPYSLEYQAAVARGNLELSNCFRNTGHMKEAFQTAQDSLASLEKMVSDNPAIDEYRYLLAWANQEIGSYYDKNNKPDQSIVFYQHSLTILEQLSISDPQNNYKWKLSEIYFGLAQIYYEQNNTLESLAFFYKCNHLRKELLANNPKAMLAHQRLIESLEETEKVLQHASLQDKANEIQGEINGLKTGA